MREAEIKINTKCFWDRKSSCRVGKKGIEIVSLTISEISRSKTLVTELNLSLDMKRKRLDGFEMISVLWDCTKASLLIH